MIFWNLQYLVKFSDQNWLLFVLHKCEYLARGQGKTSKNTCLQRKPFPSYLYSYFKTSGVILSSTARYAWRKSKWRTSTFHKFYYWSTKKVLLQKHSRIFVSKLFWEKFYGTQTFIQKSILTFEKWNKK